MATDQDPRFIKRPRNPKDNQKIPIERWPTEKLAQVLPVLVKQLNLEEKAKTLSVLSLWDHVVPQTFFGRTAAVKLKIQGGKRQLVVRVDNPALAGELSFHLNAILAQLNAYAPQTGFSIDQIVLQTR